MFFVIPFFKNTDFLRETLASLVAQTDTSWSAVVLDDSIQPREAALAEECVQSFQDLRITYRKNPLNLGLARNWNQGIDLAKDQELMVILHADDRLMPDYVAEMGALAKRYPEATGYFCKPEIIGSESEPVFSMADWYKERLIQNQKEVVLSGLDGGARLIPGYFIFCPTLCYRVGKLGCERFRADLKMVLDFELVLRVLYAGGTWVGYYDHALFQYRRHQHNTTLTLNKDLTRFREESSMYLILAQKLEAAGMQALAKKAKRMRVILLNLGFQMLKSLLTLQWRALMRETQLFMELFTW